MRLRISLAALLVKVDAEDGGGKDAHLGDEIGKAVRQGPRFARPGPGEHAPAALGGHDGLPLLGIEVVKNLVRKNHLPIYTNGAICDSRASRLASPPTKYVFVGRGFPDAPNPRTQILPSAAHVVQQRAPERETETDKQDIRHAFCKQPA